LRHHISISDRGFFRKEANSNWWFWRPILSGALTYTEASEMDQYEIMECNAAIDKKIRDEKIK
jgi:hypothetical protein